jgi:hypothetical protein
MTPARIGAPVTPTSIVATVSLTRISPASARAEILAVTCTAIPVTPVVRTVTSPACKPMRRYIPSSAASERISTAHATALLASENRARKPSPAVSTS